MSDVHAGLVIAGRYRLETLIGEGGMATVWRAVDLSLSRNVAVKVLRPEIAAQSDAVGRFRREAHAAAKLNHPNIVQIYDTGVDGTIHYIVMEYLPEPDLKKIIRDWAPLPESKVIDVATQCCRALAYAHRNGIVHRDVKPHNILFTDDGRAKLSDFGIAAAVGTAGLGPGGQVLGSAQYMSPEQIQGSPAGPHSDLYSVGCVMYEALCGRPPFEGKSQAEIAAKHLRERPVALRTLNPAVSPSTEFVVNKAMAREVARRYRTADEMLADLGKLSAGGDLNRTGVLAAPQGATAVLQPPPPRPTVVAADDRMEVVPGPAPRVPEKPTEVAPVLRPPPRPQTSAWATVAVTSIVLVGLLLVAWLAKVALFPGKPGRPVQVPLVKGMTLAQATDALTRAGLKVGEVTFRADAARADGVVLDQSPREGQMAPKGSPVALVLNRGTEMVIAVSVEGMTLEEATQTLGRAGLTVGDIEEAYHSQIPAGRVIKQRIRPGVKLEKGAAIGLVISKGPQPPPVVTPPSGPQEPEGTLVEDPDVSVVEDEGYQSSTPGERRFTVTVTAQGQARGQRIEVVLQDDRTGGRKVVLRTKLDPNETKQIPVVTQGTATIEVIHNGRVVFSEEKQAPSTTTENAVPPPAPAPD